MFIVAVPEAFVLQLLIQLIEIILGIEISSNTILSKLLPSYWLVICNIPAKKHGYNDVLTVRPTSRGLDINIFNMICQ